MKAKSKSQRKKALHGTDTTAQTTGGKIQHSVLQTGKDLLIGVIGGGIVGAVVGKPSLLIGAGITGYGHYSGKSMLTTFGIGMMASGGFYSAKGGSPTGTQGIEGFSKEDMKARILSFKDSVTSRLFLDKIIKKKVSENSTESGANGTEGVGAIQYFTYPNQNKELDFSALDQLENQIVKSGAEYQKSIQGTDTEETVQGRYAESIDINSPSY